MPPSQLKRLKASLREQGITGPQKSKKQIKSAAASGNTEQRLQKQAALQSIRDSFNPFEVKVIPRDAKFASMSDRKVKPLIGRPGVTRSIGEKTRRQNLLPELQKRNKSGGIVDRRIGEDDLSMTPEERALQRYIREKQRKKSGSMFDLENDEEEETMDLTHGGRPLEFGEEVDDFKEVVEGGSDDGSDYDGGLLKRRRTSITDEVEDEEADEGPTRKKSKKEVMEEVIAKSKLHKYERQKAKEDDDELRARLDSEMGDMLELLRGVKKPAPPDVPRADASINADRLLLMQGRSKEEADKEYDTRLRKLAQDQKAVPAERTKTEQEKAQSEAQKLKELEESRQRRMMGEESDTEEVVDEKIVEKEKHNHLHNSINLINEVEEEIGDDAMQFGFQAPKTKTRSKTKLVQLDDEDEFELDDDLVASDSDDGNDDDSNMSIDEEYESTEEQDASSSSKTNKMHDEDEEDEFVRGILDDSPEKGSQRLSKTSHPSVATNGVAFTFPCPTSHQELLDVLKDTKIEDLPIILQRIRALYHPSLSAENKVKLGDFSASLVDHLDYMGNHSDPLTAIEVVIRHVHSLSRTFPEIIGNAFRKHLQVLYEKTDINAGHLIILTAIGSIYPTSDHFHQVVTPAMLLIARWLGTTNPTTFKHLKIGACLISLCISYQRISKRYIPEAIRFYMKALETSIFKTTTTIQSVYFSNLLSLCKQYSTLPSFPSIILSSRLLPLLSTFTGTKSLISNIKILLSQSKLSLRPLLLHRHRPLAIRSSNPRFESTFDPTKHYDPDRSRSDAAKLKKEYKREKKGAVRELRKDARFIAREQLREKKETDAAYEKKFRRVIAEIQSEEGREAKGYERERERRKNSKKR